MDGDVLARFGLAEGAVSHGAAEDSVHHTNDEVLLPDTLHHTSQRPKKFYRLLKFYGTLPLPLFITMAGNRPREFVAGIEHLQESGFIKLDLDGALEELRILAEQVESGANGETSALINTFTERARFRKVTADCNIRFIK